MACRAWTVSDLIWSFVGNEAGLWQLPGEGSEKSGDGVMVQISAVLWIGNRLGATCPKAVRLAVENRWRSDPGEVATITSTMSKQAPIPMKPSTKISYVIRLPRPSSGVTFEWANPGLHRILAEPYGLEGWPDRIGST